jgi:hypothetical protein
MTAPTEPILPALCTTTFPILDRSAVPSTVDALSVLLNDVVRARATLAQQRRMPQNKLEPSGMARAAMLSALEAYTAALDARRLPVPYALRDELRIQQRVRP